MSNSLNKVSNFIGFDLFPTMKADPRNLSKSIVPIQLQRIKQDALTWRTAIEEMERAYFPYRVQVQQLYIDTILNGHVIACKERRKDLTLLRDWQVVTGKGKAKVLDEKTTELLNETWFTSFMSLAHDALAYGYTLVALGDVTDGKFNNLEAVRRWNISPDRLIVSPVTYDTQGTSFITDAQVAKWHVYVPTPNEIGTSPCGYGYLYNVGIYEIFLRNILGYNGDFVELFSQPYRVGKTSKTNEAERQEFANTLADMGSQGWAMLDTDGDVIEFLESNLGGSGTGWKGYENLEQRLEKKISKIILGHADALDSTPGKLGAGQGDDDPVSSALRDKQTKDGAFISDVINTTLLPKLRKLGFSIPPDAVFEFKNDAEVADNNNKVTALAVELYKAGHKMDAKYYEDQTGVKLAEPEIVAAPAETPAQKIENRLKKLYDAK